MNTATKTAARADATAIKNYIQAVATAERTKASADQTAEDAYTSAVNTAGFQQLSRNQQASQTQSQRVATNKTTYETALVAARRQLTLDLRTPPNSSTLKKVLCSPGLRVG